MHLRELRVVPQLHLFQQIAALHAVPRHLLANRDERVAVRLLDGRPDPARRGERVLERMAQIDRVHATGRIRWLLLLRALRLRGLLYAA